jgi:uncharacterized protein DUF4190
VAQKFNPPPGWPVPYGFEPPADWEPDPGWPPAPPGWPLWIGADTARPVYQGSASGYVPGYLRTPPGAEPNAPAAGHEPADDGRPTGKHAAPAATAPAYAWQNPAPYNTVQPRQGTNGWAVASLVFGILGGIVLGVTFGIIALVQIGRRPQAGRPLAIAGLVMSGVWAAVIAGAVGYGLLNTQHGVIAGGSSQGAGSSQRAGTRAVRVSALRAGACFRYPQRGRPVGGMIKDVTPIPCRKVHDAQVFARFRVRGGHTYPGRKALLAQGRHDCGSVLRAKLDRAKVTTRMSLIDAVPPPDAWFMGERTITCVVVDPGGHLKGSLLRAHANG